MLDPTRWFIVIPDMFGNGLSSSPSTVPDYPALVTTTDNVHAQRRLLRDAFGIEQVACVYGFSMGAQQAYHWAALYPDIVDAAVIVCGSARTAVHNQVFLRSLLATLEAAPEHIGGGRFSAVPKAALRAFARIYAGWAMSQDWYRAGLHLTSTGAATLDEFLDDHWEPGFTRRAAEDLYAQACTWMASDISANELYGGDLVRALKAIRARVLLMPGGPISISRSLTTRTRSPISPTPNCGQFPASGGIEPATRQRTRRMRGLSKRPCAPGSRGSGKHAPSHRAVIPTKGPEPWPSSLQPTRRPCARRPAIRTPC